MCYRISTSKTEKIKDLFKGFKVDDMNAYFHLAGHTHQPVPVIKPDAQDHIQPVQWGLKPWWPTKDFKEAQEHENRTLNTMAEYAFKKLPFPQVARQERCILLVEGFYEFRHVPGTKKTPDKEPYFIYMPDQATFAMPGVLWSWGHPEDGEIFQTVSLLTTKANERMSHIHNSKLRMPAILDRGLWDEWLDPKVTYKAPAPYRDGILKDHIVANYLKKGMPDPDRPETQLPLTVDSGPLSLF